MNTHHSCIRDIEVGITYADDHPGNHIPALRFAFEVTR
jgi:hypothetical protein